LIVVVPQGILSGTMPAPGFERSTRRRE